MNLFGHFHVTPTPAAMTEAQKLFHRYGDYQELRKHALKLAFWPGGIGPTGQVVDLDWEEIKGMAPPRACELRIDDEIAGFDNLRVIFYVFDKDWIRHEDIMPRLWTIGVLQKKTRRWTTNNLKTFRGRVIILRKREYGDYV